MSDGWQTTCADRLGRKEAHQRLRGQATSCRWNLKVRDRRVRRLRRLALPSPAEIIPTERRDASIGGAAKDHHANGGRVNARTPENGFISVGCWGKIDSLVPLCTRSARLRATGIVRECIRGSSKSSIVVARTKASYAICTSQDCEMLVSTRALHVCASPKNRSRSRHDDLDY